MPEGESVEDAISTGRANRIVTEVFTRTLGPLIRSASLCEVHGTIPKLPVEGGERWRAMYLRSARGLTRVDLDADGIGGDIAFWWWLVRGRADLLLCGPRRRLDLDVLFMHAWNPAEGNYTAGPKVARAARQRTRDGDSVCLHPKAEGLEIQLTVVANPKTVTRLFLESLSRARFQSEVLVQLDGCVRPLDDLHAAYFRIELMGEQDPERYLRKVLDRVAGRVHDRKAVDAALFAAEFIAAMEKRGALGLCHTAEAAAEFEDWTSRQPGLSIETLTLARSTIEHIAENVAFLDDKQLDETLVAPWRAMIGELHQRLRACEATRRARARAPNARLVSAPTPTSTDLRPERFASLSFYATTEDVDLLFDLVHDCDARLLVREDGEVSEVGSSWQMREALSQESEVSPLGARSTWFRIWWPSVIASPDANGWGLARLCLRGPLDGDKRAIAPSFVKYPTGGELRGPRFVLPGPWHEVDWPELRRRVRQLKASLARCGRKPNECPRSLVLHGAATLLEQGWQLVDKYGSARPVPFVR